MNPVDITGDQHQALRTIEAIAYTDQRDDDYEAAREALRGRGITAARLRAWADWAAARGTQTADLAARELHAWADNIEAKS